MTVNAHTDPHRQQGQGGRLKHSKTLHAMDWEAEFLRENEKRIQRMLNQMEENDLRIRQAMFDYLNNEGPFKFKGYLGTVGFQYDPAALQPTEEAEFEVVSTKLHE